MFNCISSLLLSLGVSFSPSLFVTDCWFVITVIIFRCRWAIRVLTWWWRWNIFNWWCTWKSIVVERLTVMLHRGRGRRRGVLALYDLITCVTVRWKKQQKTSTQGRAEWCLSFQRYLIASVFLVHIWQSRDGSSSFFLSFSLITVLQSFNVSLTLLSRVHSFTAWRHTETLVDMRQLSWHHQYLCPFDLRFGIIE